jgi:YD repeat-containing protein
MKGRLALTVALSLTAGMLMSELNAQTTGPAPDQNPTANTGALKPQIETAGSYDAHSGNATRIIPDLRVPGAVGIYGLDFTRYWNSLRDDRDRGNLYPHFVPDPVPNQDIDFGSPGWSHSWSWRADYEDYSEEVDSERSYPYPAYTIVTMAITITFPDGHASKYNIQRSVQAGGNVTPGPPYGPGEANWTRSGEIHDYLEGMVQNGSQFWLHRADGGSVHFVDSGMGYQATEVFDPYGLLTTLHYRPDGNLDYVQQDGGRRLNFRWDIYCNQGVCQNVIGRVDNVASGATQGVEYGYSWLGPWLTLTSVTYPEAPPPGESAVAAAYTCQRYTPPSGFFEAGPLLATADDPHFEGPMTRIAYSYRNSGCLPTGTPPPAYPNGQFDYFLASPTTIEAEKSWQRDDYNNQIVVSRFTLGCFDGTRTEYNGLGGFRKFFYGRSAGAQGTFNLSGYQLTKLTDFTSVYPLPLDLPFERQNYLAGEPRQIWDGRGILTETVHADGSGFPSEVRHVGSDGSSATYNRVNPGNSEAQDFSRVPNPYHHWLFSKTDERSQTTIYTRDSRRRVKEIYYHDGSAEHFTYNDLNQVLTHMLPSGAVVHYEYDGLQHLVREWNDVDGQGNAVIYTYDTLERVASVSYPWSVAAGASFSVALTYNGRHKVIREEYPATSPGPNPFKSYGYDSYGNCTSITDEMGHTSLYEYDSYRRCTSYTEPLNAPDAWDNNIPSRRWDWIYDRYIVDNNYYPVAGGYRDASAHTVNSWRIQVEPGFNYLGERPMTHRFHDVNGRMVLEQTGWIQRAAPAAIGNWYWSGQGETVYYTYDENGQKKSYTDPLGRLTTYDYDLRNRLWKTNETVNTTPRTTETLYDPTGNKTLVRFPDQRTQQWLDYDPFGQPGRFIDERGNTTNILYWWGPMKKLGMVTTHRDRDAGGTEDQVTVFSYDYLGRPTHVWFPDGGYAYGSHEDSTYESGQLKTWTTRKGQTKTIQYDGRGRETSHTWNDGQTPGITRTWDSANRLTSISNSVATINYVYDDAAQPLSESESITGAGGAAVTGYRRYGNGAIWNLIYPNGMRTARAYSPQLRLPAVWDHGPNNWQGAIKLHLYGRRQNRSGVLRKRNDDRLCLRWPRLYFAREHLP